MKKVIPYYIVYIALLILFYSNFGFHLIDGTLGRTIIGIIIFILLTGLTSYLTISTLKKNTLNKLIAIDDDKAQLTEQQKLARYITFFSEIGKSYYGPFDKSKDDMLLLVTRMQDKMFHLNNLLSDSFSKEDITYITYKDSLNEILKIYNNNLKGIKKRIEVFDYSDWRNNNQIADPVAQSYIDEVSDLMQRNDEILNQVDNLLLELVRMDDISDSALIKINDLIKQTQNYKKVREE